VHPRAPSCTLVHPHIYPHAPTFTHIHPQLPGERELQVLDYQNCAGTLLPLVAGAYALWIMGDEMMAMYKRWGLSLCLFVL
jgi:hypothetical protein